MWHLMLCVPGICHGHWLVYAQGSCHVGALSWTEARCIAILLMPRCHDMTPPFFYFACLWPSLCCHANTGMVVWSLPIWQHWARLFSGQRQKEAEMKILKRRLDLVLHSVSSGRKKVKCNLYTENWPLSSGRLFYSNYDIETTLVWVCRRSE